MRERSSAVEKKDIGNNVMQSIEMANADSPEEIVRATQRTLMTSFLNIIKDLKADNLKIPGLTWTQLEYMIEEFNKREIVIVYKKGDV